MPTVKLRPATNDDFPAAWEIYNQILHHHMRSFVNLVGNDQRNRFATIWRPSITSMIEVDGRTAGFVSIDETSSPQIIVEQFHIHEDYQKQGIGNELIASILEGLKAKNKPIAFDILKGSPAKEIVEKLGFKSVGEDDFVHKFQSAA